MGPSSSSPFLSKKSLSNRASRSTSHESTAREVEYKDSPVYSERRARTFPLWKMRPELVQERDQLQAIRYRGLRKCLIPAKGNNFEMRCLQSLYPCIYGEPHLFLYGHIQRFVRLSVVYSYPFVLPQRSKEVPENVNHTRAPLSIFNLEGRTCDI